MRKLPWRLIVGITAVLLLLFAVYAGWLVLSTERALTRASSDGHTLKLAITAGDQAAVSRSVADLQRDAGTADKRTGGITWWVLRHVPVLGDDFSGVRVVSHATAALSRSNLAELANETGDLDKILPSGGRIDLAELAKLAPTVADGNDALAKAARQLGAQDSSGFVGPLKTKYRDLQAQVDEAASAIGTADRALQVMPTMLGAHGTRHFILVMQNNAEIRATGGLPGAISELEAKDGRVTMVRQTSGGAFGSVEHDVLPLTSTEVGLYGHQLGEYFLDANFTPDFPRAADLMRARWSEQFPGRIDGVLAVDPVTVSYLLRVTGPITVDGVDLTADNVVDQLLHDSYVRIADPNAQDAFFRDVARAVFDKVVGGLPNPRQVVSALRQGADEHRILVHSFDPSLQRSLAGTPVGGDVPTAVRDSPQVGVYLNDSTGAKMSYYLRYQAKVSATSCAGGVQDLTGSMSVASTAPADAASLPAYVTGAGVYDVPPGTQIASIMLFGPLGGTLDKVQIDGADAAPQQWFNLDGRPVIKVSVTLKPGQSDQLTWHMTTGPGQGGATVVGVTPSIVSGDSSSTVPSAC